MLRSGDIWRMLIGRGRVFVTKEPFTLRAHTRVSVVIELTEGNDGVHTVHGPARPCERRRCFH